MYTNVNVTSLNTVELWHSRITCDAIDSNNMMYKTFKYSHGKEKYTEILPEHFKKALFQFRMGTHKLPVNNSRSGLNTFRTKDESLNTSKTKLTVLSTFLC